MKRSSVFLVFVFLIFASSFKKIGTTPPIDGVTPPVNMVPVADTFVCPVYPDNFISVSSLDIRSQWKLANEHDTIFTRCENNCYRYHTNVSYGHVFNGNSYYPYRRFKDLANWDFLGTAFTSLPAKVKLTFAVLTPTGVLIEKKSCFNRIFS